MDENKLPGTEDELSEILLALSQDEKELRAVKGVKNGELETVPAEKTFEGEFLKLDSKQSALKNFWSNFVRELKNPSKVKIIKIRLLNLEKVKEAFKNDTPEKKEILTKNLVRILEELQKEREKDREANKQDTNLKNGNSMDTNEVPQSGVQNDVKNETGGELRFKPEELDWDGLKNYGLTREQIEKNGVLEEMCKGFKSPYTFPIRLNTDLTAINFDARLYFKRLDDGKVKLIVDGVRSYPKLEQKFFEHEFSDNDKLNLRTTGNMGRIVDIKDYRTGLMVPSLISIDKITNAIVAYPAQKAKIPDVYREVTLTNEQKSALKDGKFVKLEDMKMSDNKIVSGYVQYSAEKKYLETVFPARIIKAEKNQKLDAPALEFRGHTFSTEENGTLLTGDAVYVKLKKAGEAGNYKGFVRFNQTKGKMEFSFNNPNKVKVNPTDKTDEQTKERKEKKAEINHVNVNDNKEKKHRKGKKI